MKPFLSENNIINTNLFVHSCERCLSKGRALQRFCPLGNNFIFFAGSQQNVKKSFQLF